MNEPQYKLIFNDREKSSLQLCKSNTLIREWFGCFAEIIWNMKKNNLAMINNSICLSKKQVYHLFAEVTGIYQNLNFKLNINKDLLAYNFSKEQLKIAESILLHIRLNSCHLNYDDLNSHIFDEFNFSNSQLIDKTLNLLIGNKFILSIITTDGLQFFDKDTKPHNHIYFKKHKKLIDSTKELTEIMEDLGCIKTTENNLSSLYIY